MNSFDRQWQKLTAAARQAPGETADVPYGFATRVAAQAAVPVPAPWGSLERFAVRGFLAAIACCGGAVAFSFGGHQPELPLDTALDETVRAAAEPIRVDE